MVSEGVHDELFWFASEECTLCVSSHFDVWPTLNICNRHILLCNVSHLKGISHLTSNNISISKPSGYQIIIIIKASYSNSWTNRSTRNLFNYCKELRYYFSHYPPRVCPVDKKTYIKAIWVLNCFTPLNALVKIYLKEIIERSKRFLVRFTWKK